MAIKATMSIITDAIDERGFFDSRYTCDADNSSPELRWNHVPEGTAGFALIAEDPDAPSGLFTHWLIYNLGAELRHLPAGIPPQEILPNKIQQGLNSFGKLGYGGPCPPSGHTAHRYVFRLYALRELPPLVPRMTREEVLSAITPLVLAQTETMGRYERGGARAHKRAG
ncbi:MAG: YbhB/YbcL family Raf kinase inhibitor-like protein [Bdellovibrionota bacterium]